MPGHGAALLTTYTPSPMVAALDEAPTGMGNAYFGSKAATGLCQPLIALMPPHSTYIETHLGGGAIMRRKPGALRNIGVDLDERALAGNWGRRYGAMPPAERLAVLAAIMAVEAG